MELASALHKTLEGFVLMAYLSQQSALDASTLAQLPQLQGRYVEAQMKGWDTYMVSGNAALLPSPAPWLYPFSVRSPLQPERISAHISCVIFVTKQRTTVG